MCEKFSVEYIPGKEIPEDELLFVEPTMDFADEIAAYRQEMRMQIHNILAERMKKYTGHVGYSVRPSERRKGYAKKILLHQRTESVRLC